VQNLSVAFRRSVRQAGRAESEFERRSPSNRPCAHDDLDSTQLCGVASGGRFQGQKHIPSCPGVWKAEAELSGADFLGEKILRTYGRERRGHDPGVHLQPADGRPEAGSDEPLELTCYCQGGPIQPIRVSDPFQSALSGSRSKAPGSARRYLLRYVVFPRWSWLPHKSVCDNFAVEG